jgi:hypothetical protein
MASQDFGLTHYRMIVFATYLLPLLRYWFVDALVSWRKEYSIKNWYLIVGWNLFQIFVLWNLWTELRLENSLSLKFDENLRAFVVRLICYGIFMIWDLIKIKFSESSRNLYFGILISDFSMIAISSYVWLQL